MKKCLHCQNDCRRKFCSNKCQQDYQYVAKVNLWKQGKLKVTRGPRQISCIIRRYLFEKHDGKCAICGWNEKNPITGVSPLEVDHIDGNYMNGAEENLTLLCPNHHALTPTYKNLNNKRGR